MADALFDAKLYDADGNWIDIDDTVNYSLYGRFAPPDTVMAGNIGSGTALNEYSGASKHGEQAEPRDWKFSVRCLGESDEEVRLRHRILREFLSRAQEDRPLTFSLKPQSHTPDPMHSFHASPRFYTIIHVRTAPLSEITWTRGTKVRQKVAILNVECLLNPFALTVPLRAGTATGGITQDKIGTQNGLSRGVQIPPAGTNKYTNPINGHSTFNNGYSVGSSLQAKEIVGDERIIKRGSACRLTSSAASNNLYTQSLTLTVATYKSSFYVYLPDRSKPTDSVCQIHYAGTDVSTTFDLLPGSDGIYRAHADITGQASAQATGLVVHNGYTVIVQGFQAETDATYPLPSPLMHGDEKGHAWSGTAHASSTDRTAAYLRLPIEDRASETFLPGGMTVQQVWRMNVANTDYSTGAYFFAIDTGSLNFHVRYRATGTLIRFRDGTSNLDSSTVSWSKGDYIVITIIWKQGERTIYWNGTQIGNTSDFVPPDVSSQTWWYLGSTDGPATYIVGTLMGHSTWARGLTSAEVNDNYTNVLKAIENGDILDAVPYGWTNDGDDIVDNCLSSGSTYPYAVFEGIPGDYPALTELRLVPANTTTEKEFLINHNVLPHFLDPNGNIFFDKSGSVVAGSCGGQVEASATIGTSAVEDFQTTLPLYSEYLSGKMVHPWVRLNDGTGNLRGTFAWDSSPFGAAVVGEYKDLSAADSTYRGFLLPGLSAPSLEDLGANNSGQADGVFAAALYFKRTTGSGTINVDYLWLMPGTIARVTAGTNLSGLLYFRVIDGKGAGQATQTDLLTQVSTHDGPPIELVPNKTNLLMIAMGDEAGANDITNTMTFSATIVTPRLLLI